MKSSSERYACRVDIDDIAMLGKWNNEHMVKSYVNGVPVAAVLARAGHDNLLHLLPRSTVEPDQSLLEEIFPGVEKMLEEKKRVQNAALAMQQLAELPLRQLCRCAGICLSKSSALGSTSYKLIR